MRMGDAGFVEQFEDARRPGAYRRIGEPGSIAAGDAITVGPAAAPVVRIGDLGGEATPELLRRIVADERVPEGWRHGAARALRPAG
jgi:MOSC domain-containing protein YiiM